MTETVDIHSALRSYTAWGARQMFLESKIGTLEVSKKADIAIWDRARKAFPSLRGLPRIGWMAFLARLLKDISECISQDVEFRLSDFCGNHDPAVARSEHRALLRLARNLQLIN